MYIDSHCHIDCIELEEGQTIRSVIDEAHNAQVEHMLVVSIDLNSKAKLEEIANNHENISISCGVHPNEILSKPLELEYLLAGAAHNKCVAIGETGLDYFRSDGDLEWQRDRFRLHITAAKNTSLPLIIHTRDAAFDTIKIMREEKADTCGGVMHCFAENWEVAKQALDLGFYISFSGIVSFKNAKELHEVAKKVPRDRMLIETDSPYLAPMPYRGKPNKPAWVPYVAEAISILRNDPIEEIASITKENFYSLFQKAIYNKNIS